MEGEPSIVGKTLSREAQEVEQEVNDEFAPLKSRRGPEGAAVDADPSASSLPPGGEAASVLKTLLVVGAWFFFSIAIGILTKWMFLHGKICDAGGQSCVPYKFPFALTAVHMFVSWLVCSLILWMRPPASASFGLSDHVRKIIPLALAFAGSVGLGNLTLKYIYPSFSHMLGSTTPLVTVFVSMCLTGKRYNMWTWASMPIICGGLIACSRWEANYNVLGVLCMLASTVLRGAKSVLQEKLLDPSEKAHLDTISLLHLFCPWAMAFLVLLSLCVEGLEPISMLLPTGANSGHTGVATVLLLLAVSGLMATFLNICGTFLTASLGAVMLQILGNVKGCVTILLSALALHNEVAPLQLFGMALCLGGVWIYQRKGRALKPDELPQATSGSKSNGLA